MSILLFFLLGLLCFLLLIIYYLLLNVYFIKHLRFSRFYLKTVFYIFFFGIFLTFFILIKIFLTWKINWILQQSIAYLRNIADLASSLTMAQKTCSSNLLYLSDFQNSFRIRKNPYKWIWRPVLFLERIIDLTAILIVILVDLACLHNRIWRSLEIKVVYRSPYGIISSGCSLCRNVECGIPYSPAFLTVWNSNPNEVIHHLMWLH